MSKASQFLDKLIALCIYGIVGIVPIFFLPFTADAVEFNKQFLLYLLVILGIISWVIKGIVTKKLVIRRTPLDIPLLLIIATMLISAIASKNRYLSFWGDFNMLGDSFVSFIFYILFYFLVLNNVDSVKRVVKIIIVLAVSGAFSALYFIGQSFGILPLSGLPVPRWTLNSDLPTHFGYYMTVVMILVLSLVMAKMRGFFNKKNIFGLIALLIFFTAIVVLGFKSV